MRGEVVCMVLVACILVFAFLFGITYLGYSSRHGCDLASTRTPNCALYEKMDFAPETQNQGKRHMKKSTVVLCGLVRDGEHGLKRNISQLAPILKKFGDYRVLVVENDSRDNSRQILLEWAEQDPKVLVLGCGVNAPHCEMNLNKTEGHEITYTRIQKMAILRNLYIDYIKTYLSEFDYMLVFDFDIIGHLYVDGLKDSFGVLIDHPEINGVTANGVRHTIIGEPTYYDTFALFGLTSPSCFRDAAAKIQDEQFIRKVGVIPSTSESRFKFIPKFGLIPVKSAFAGFGIFRITPIVRNDASYTLNCPDITCEHTALADSIGGQIYINPNMVLFVYEH
jgi:hypothetical protein